jgi:hypothetical protein
MQGNTEKSYSDSTSKSPHETATERRQDSTLQCGRLHHWCSSIGPTSGGMRVLQAHTADIAIRTARPYTCQQLLEMLQAAKQSMPIYTATQTATQTKVQAETSVRMQSCKPWNQCGNAAHNTIKV